MITIVPIPNTTFSCTYSVMPTSISRCCFSTSSTLTHYPVLHKTYVTPSLNVPKFPQKPINTTCLREFCKQGNLKEALRSLSNLFADYNVFAIRPDEVYALVLDLCASKKAILQGKQIHAHLIKSLDMYESSFLETKLVYMYGKCGSVSDAEKLFGKIPQRTIFTWNAMLGAYVSSGGALRALETYREMRVLGISLDAFTFPCVIKACAMLKDLDRGAEIHGLVIKCGNDSISFVVNSLVAMYAKCYDLHKARQLFDRMGEKEDVVLWNSIISAYSASGQCLEALGLFGEMQRAGLVTNAYTFVAALQACEDSSFEILGKEIHAATVKSGQNLEVYVANALIAMYARCGKMTKAAGVLFQLENKDGVSWNSMLTGFVQNDMYGDAMQLFRKLQCAGQKLDQVSIINAVSASGRLGNLLNGMELHAYAIKQGFVSNLQVGNTLIDMYAKCCYVNYMDRVFYQMLAKDFISWTTIIAGYALNNCHVKALALFRKVQIEGMEADEMMIGSILMACSGLKCMSHMKEIHGYIIRKGLSDLVIQNAIVDVYGECGNIDYARNVFQSIEYKDVVSWTSLISSYVHNGLANEALELFYSMNETNVESDSITLVSALSAAASLSILKKGKEIHGFIIRKFLNLEGSIASSLVDMYARCGALDIANNVFNCVRNKDLILWTSMINANGLHGRGKVAIDLFYKMEESFVPDHITFLSLLYACSHSGLINEGKGFLEIMRCKYQLEPWPEHYTCLVDLLGRANRLEEAYQFLRSMQTDPTAEAWCALLRACWVHSNKELGEIAVKKLLELDSCSSGNYILISNVFAASRRWKDVDQVRIRMRGSGLKKTPGCSWIEIGNKLHTFIARDESHPEFDEIYKKLAQITEKLEKGGGYVAQTQFVLHNVEEEEKVQILYGHSERLAIAYGLLKCPEGTLIRITKNLRICVDCHTFCKLVSRFLGRKLVVRDANRFHHFEAGVCSCGDYW